MEMDQDCTVIRMKIPLPAIDIHPVQWILAHDHIEDELIVLYIWDAPTGKSVRLYEP